MQHDERLCSGHVHRGGRIVGVVCHARPESRSRCVLDGLKQLKQFEQFEQLEQFEQFEQFVFEFFVQLLQLFELFEQQLIFEQRVTTGGEGAECKGAGIDVPAPF